MVVTTLRIRIRPLKKYSEMEPGAEGFLQTSLQYIEGFAGKISGADIGAQMRRAGYHIVTYRASKYFIAYGALVTLYIITTMGLTDVTLDLLKHTYPHRHPPLSDTLQLQSFNAAVDAFAIAMVVLCVFMLIGIVCASVMYLRKRQTINKLLLATNWVMRGSVTHIVFVIICIVVCLTVTVFAIFHITCVDTNVLIGDLEVGTKKSFTEDGFAAEATKYFASEVIKYGADPTKAVNLSTADAHFRHLIHSLETGNRMTWTGGMSVIKSRDLSGVVVGLGRCWSLGATAPVTTLLILLFFMGTYTLLAAKALMRKPPQPIPCNVNELQSLACYTDCDDGPSAWEQTSGLTVPGLSGTRHDTYMNRRHL
uniref:Structural envelope n=1 Tax=Latid herpesvirus 1 TaxID=3096545 RepID=A0AB33V6N0_9VIRU